MKRLLIALCSALALVAPAQANFTITTGTGTTIVALDASNQGTSSCAAATTECPATAIINAAGTVNSAAAPLFASLSQGGALSATNGIYSNLLQGNAVLSATNGLFSNVLQGNAVLSATNGLFANILQGNAVLSATNPLPGNIAQMGGTAINSGCVAALSGFTTTIPSTVCGVFGAYVLNATGLGRAVAASANPVVTVAAASLTGEIAPNNTTAIAVKSGSTVVYGAQLGNIGSIPAYVKIYNATSATCGSGTPVKRLIIPAASTAANGAGNTLPLYFTLGTGFTYCVTTGIADTDTTAPTASQVLVNFDYE